MLYFASPSCMESVYYETNVFSFVKWYHRKPVQNSYESETFQWCQYCTLGSWRPALTGLDKFYPNHIHFLSTFYPLFINFLSTFYQLFISFLSTPSYIHMMSAGWCWLLMTLSNFALMLAACVIGSAMQDRFCDARLKNCHQTLSVSCALRVPSPLHQ